MRYSHKALLLATLAAAALIAAPAHAGTNLLTNSSFEVQGNGSDETAYRWNFNNPDTHAGYWGSFARRSWRAKSGTWEGTLQGRWIGVDFGGVWQEGPATPGTTYEASGWFFADVPGTTSGGAFTAAVQELKIEFYSASFGSPLSTVQTNLICGEGFTQKTLRATAPLGTAWARWVAAVSGTSPNGALQFDDVELRAITLREQNFNDWTSNTNDAAHVRDDWTVSTGKTQTANSRSGYCANLGNAGTIATNGHFIKSPLLSDGIGTISFWYRHETGVTALTYEVQTSVNGTNWVTVGGITNVLNTNYVQFSKYIYAPTQQYARIYHVAGSGRLLVDDISVAAPTPVQRVVDFDDWPGTYTSNSCYSYAGWDLCTGLVNTVDALVGQAAAILGSSGGGNYLQSPLYSNGVGTVTYRYRALTNSTAVGFSVQTSTNGTTWTTYSSYTGVTNDYYATNSESIYLPDGGYIRFLYNSGSANSLLIEDIDVGYPLLSRTQNFDTWPSENSYGDYTFQGWFVHQARVVSNNALSGNAATLRETVSSNAYIRSPFFPDGVGTITFSYLVDDTTPPGNVTYFVQTSTDGVTWVTNDTLTGLTNKTYQTYSQYFYLTNALYVRLNHSNGSSRVVFDEITIAAPAPPADVVINGSHRPVAPYTNETVQLFANVLPYNGAAVTSLVSYYRVGTSGAFTALGMIPTNVVNYATTSSIPAQTTGTKVQYFIRCDFGGPASASNSPRYYPSGGSNGPASYFIPRNRPGSVWINEFNYNNDFLGYESDTQEFVEIAGPAGTDITGWQIQLWLSGGNYEQGASYTYATYTITNSTVFANEHNGFGFFILADVEMGSYDIPLTITNTYQGDYSHISDGLSPSGIRLLNEAGGEEQSLCYEGSLPQFTNVAPQEVYTFDDPYSIQLAGSGTGYTAFAWIHTNGMSPGAVNVGQSFPPSGNSPPDVWFSSIVLGTNVTMYYTGNSNSWTIAPVSTTNLNSPQTWSPVTPFFSSTNAVWFDRPTNYTRYIFRLSVTN